MIHENAQNRFPGLGPEETRPLAALRNDDRHSPWLRIPPDTGLKKPFTGFKSPPCPPQSTAATTAKEITNDKTFETKHYDDEMNELRSTNRER